MTKRKPLELFSESEIKAAPRFMPKPVLGRVYSVYDGDTISVLGYQGETAYRFSVRVLGVDTPEMRGKTDLEKKLAAKAKAFVEQRCLDKIVELKNHVKEKYGRVCAEVWIDGSNLASELITAGLGKPYDGGAKMAWA